MKAWAVVIAVTAALVVASTAAATTDPAKKITLVVVINDKGLNLAAFTQLGVPPAATLSPLAGPVPRGDYVSVNVYNRGSKAHDFTIFGKKTRPVKPGGKAHLFVAAMKRGKFLYRSTLDQGKAFQGYLRVGEAGMASSISNPG